MKNKYLKIILEKIKEGKFQEIDSILYEYFEKMLNEYNFNFVHNQIYSRRNDEQYNEDCKTIHIFAKGFNYRMRKLVNKNGKKLSESLEDAPNSLLLQYVSRPALVSDLLNYLHTYIYGLSKPASKRRITASEFLRFEDMLKRWREFLKR